jgi:pyroglutamyl-peptidase
VKNVLLTAFEPYGDWASNASWLCLEEITRDLPASPRLTTRRYPVDFDSMRDRLLQDLAADYDVALHLGQAPGSTRLRLERFAINVRGEPNGDFDQFSALREGGPPAYESALPLATWSAMLRDAGVPAQVSHHAGTYLCNATLYWSHHLSRELALRTKSAFIHLPLECSQVLEGRQDQPSLPATLMARAIRMVLSAIDESTPA